MYSVLVYPNITYSKDLEKDSYVVVLQNVIRELNEIRNDLEFTIISPKLIKSLEFDNTRQVYVDFPTYPNQMRIHFDSVGILDSIKWRENSYDLVFSHLPEHTLQLVNLFTNKTNERPQFFGYTHWTEFKKVSGYDKTFLDVNILGLLEMCQCGVNTQYQKDLILEAAQDKFKDEVIESLDKILKPMYLGSEVPIYQEKNIDHNRIIVFNHRAHPYKKYDWFLKQMDKLWKKRQDFQVWVPLASSKDREYITNDKYDRVGYFSKLRKCYVGIACKQVYGGWSVSATDGMSVGVPYLFADEQYYHELAGDSGFYFKTARDFLPKLEEILDNEELRNNWSIKSEERFKTMVWPSRIVDFSEMIDLSIDRIEVVKSKSKAYNRILKLIEDSGKNGITKKELIKSLNWGIRMTWTVYRNMLRSEKIRISRKKYIFDENMETSENIVENRELTKPPKSDKMEKSDVDWETLSF